MGRKVKQFYLGKKQKNAKIKRYKNIYHRSRFKMAALAVAKYAALAGVLIFVGFYASKPIIGWITADKDKPKEKPTTSSSSSASSTPKPTPPVVVDNSYCYIDYNALYTDQQIAQAVAKAKQAGATHAVIDLKITGGQVTYQSALPQVLDSKVCLAQVFDLKKVTDAFAKEKIKVSAMISAFQDSIYSGYNRQAAVTYGNQEILWLDNAPTNGGKPWLAPGKQATVDYLLAISQEAISMGVSQILLSDAVLPNAQSLAQAYFGFAGDNQSGLQSSIDTISKGVKEKGGEFGVYLTAAYYLPQSIGGVDYKALSADMLFADATLQRVADGAVIGQYTKTAQSTPQQVYDAVYELLSAKNNKFVVVSPEGVQAKTKVTFVK